MRAVVVDAFGGPERLVTTDVAVPEPGPGEVAIDVSHAGVGFVDTLFRRGEFSSLLRPRFVPGIEVAGTVRRVGPGVNRAVGEPVAALLNDFARGGRAGGYAEAVVARADLTVSVPENADPAVCAGLLVNATTARWALHRSGRLASGEDVAVLGASGGVGEVGVRLARIAGAGRVIAVVGRSEAGDAARRAGATDVVLRDDLDGALRELTDGRGVDVVLDPVGGPARRRAVDQLAFGGRLVVVGNASGQDVEISTDDMWHASRAVAGFSLGAAASTVPVAVAAEAGAAIGSIVADGRPTTVVEVGLDEAAGVHRALDEGRAPTKTVLRIGASHLDA